MPMYSEDELVPLSSLQHILFCERQYALIHLEQLWEENRFTAEGRALHERVDSEHHESRKLFHQEYSMSVRSLNWGLIGKCDLVELHLNPDKRVVQVLPVEFKRGRDKEEDVDRVQLCGQALCLEEMFCIPVVKGQFYYLAEHRRTTLEIDGSLREKTINLISRIRNIQAQGNTPIAEYRKNKCDRCSLFDLCMPKSAGGGGKRVEPYLQTQIKAVEKECNE